MAGASGCIPAYHVNFFGQLCEPAVTKSGPVFDPNEDINQALVPSKNAVHSFKRDPILALFNENQALIRGFSLGDFDTYLATVKRVLASRRRGRANAFAKPPEQEQLAGHCQVEKSRNNQTEHQDHYADRHQDQKQAQHGAGFQNQHQRQHHGRHPKHIPLLQKEEIRLQPQHRPQSPPTQPAHPCTTTHQSTGDAEDKMSPEFDYKERRTQCTA